MAETIYPVGHPLAVKLWSKKLSVESLKAMRLSPLIGRGENSIIQLKDETSNTAGGEITYGLDYQLQGPGVTGRETLEGNEESLQDGSDRLIINELAQAVRIPNGQTIDAQRVPFDLRARANARIRDWYQDRLATAFFLHVCGYNGHTITHLGRQAQLTKPQYWLFNKPTPPSSERWIIAGGRANEQSLTEEDTFDIRYIDHLKEIAILANPRINPIRVNGDDMGQWLDITKFADMGKGRETDIAKGALGYYNGVIIRSDEFVTSGVNSTNGNEIPNVKRAILLGAQAAVIAFGRKQRDTDRFFITEELFDYKRSLGVSVQSVLGIKKTQFTYQCPFDSGESPQRQDYGCLVLSTWAARSTGVLPPKPSTRGIFSITGENGISAKVSGDTATIGITAGGVGTTQLGSNAVTDVKVSSNAAIAVSKLAKGSYGSKTYLQSNGTENTWGSISNTHIDSKKEL